MTRVPARAMIGVIYVNGERLASARVIEIDYGDELAVTVTCSRTGEHSARFQIVPKPRRPRIAHQWTDGEWGWQWGRTWMFLGRNLWVSEPGEGSYQSSAGPLVSTNRAHVRIVGPR